MTEINYQNLIDIIDDRINIKVPHYFQVVDNGTDVNTLIENGIYIIRAECINVPVDHWGAIVTINTSGTIRQLYIDDVSTLIYTRWKGTAEGEVWNAWIQHKTE